MNKAELFALANKGKIELCGLQVEIVIRESAGNNGEWIEIFVEPINEYTAPFVLGEKWTEYVTEEECEEFVPALEKYKAKMEAFALKANSKIVKLKTVSKDWVSAIENEKEQYKLTIYGDHFEIVNMETIIELDGIAYKPVWSEYLDKAVYRFKYEPLKEFEKKSEMVILTCMFGNQTTEEKVPIELLEKYRSIDPAGSRLFLVCVGEKYFLKASNEFDKDTMENDFNLNRHDLPFLLHKKATEMAVSDGFDACTVILEFSDDYEKVGHDISVLIPVDLTQEQIEKVLGFINSNVYEGLQRERFTIEVRLELKGKEQILSFSGPDIVELKNRLTGEIIKLCSDKRMYGHIYVDVEITERGDYFDSDCGCFDFSKGMTTIEVADYQGKEKTWDLK